LDRPNPRAKLPCKEEPHGRHAERESKSIAETFQLDWFLVSLPQRGTDERHNQTCQYWTDHQADAMNSRRMDDGMREENQTQAARQDAQRDVNDGGNPGVLEAGAPKNRPIPRAAKSIIASPTISRKNSNSTCSSPSRSSNRNSSMSLVGGGRDCRAVRGYWFLSLHSRPLFGHPRPGIVPRLCTRDSARTPTSAAYRTPLHPRCYPTERGVVLWDKLTAAL
jgi:hypothetical protein